MEYYYSTLKREENSAMYNKKDEPGGRYIELNKPATKEWIPQDSSQRGI